jgi:uncharacterized protein YifE (UPF0438 family)
MKNKIILTAEGELIDREAREFIEKIWTKLATLNERTKTHTLEIKKLQKLVGEDL